LVWSDAQVSRSHLQDKSHPLPQLHDIPAPHSGTGSSDRGDTARTWGKSGTHAYPLQDIALGKSSTPHWMDDYMDDFGASGTRIGAPQPPYVDEDAEAAGRCLSTYPGERAQSLNPLFVQDNTFNWIPLDITGDGRPSQSSETHNLVSQETAPIFLEDLFPDIYEQITPPAGGGMRASISGQVDELDKSSFDCFLQSPDPTLQVSSELPSPKSHHGIPFNSKQYQPTQLDLILENGRGDMRTEAGVKRHPIGRRGPLPADRALRIAKTRREKSVCIPCRMKKVSVSP